MTELKIKFTTKVYGEESPIELSIEDARELYKELEKMFKSIERFESQIVSVFNSTDSEGL